MNNALELAIETSGLTRCFGSLVAVSSLRLAVPRGLIYGFLGPNGAGKSTTINMLAMLCLHIATLPAYDLVGMISPYRAQMMLSNKSQGNLWMVLAWGLASLPVLAFTLLPWVWWPAGAGIGLAVAAIYSAVVYVLTLRPLAELLGRRTFQILEVVSREE